MKQMEMMKLEMKEQEQGINRESTVITNDKTILSVVLGHLLIAMTYLANGICSTLILIFICSNPNTQGKFLYPP